MNEQRKDNRIQVRVSTELKAKAHGLAAERGTTVSDQIVAWLEEWVSEH